LLPRITAREPATGAVVEVLSEPTIEGPVKAGFFTRTDARIDPQGRIIVHAETMIPASCTDSEMRSVMAAASYDPTNGQVVREVPPGGPSPAAEEAAGKLLTELGAKAETPLVWVGAHWTASPEKGLVQQWNFARDRIVGTLDAPVDPAVTVPDAVRKFFASPTEYARLRFGFAKATEKIAAANFAAFLPDTAVWKPVAAAAVQARLPEDGGLRVRGEPAPLEGPFGPKDAVIVALADGKDGVSIVVVGEQVVPLRVEKLGAAGGAAMMHVDADDDADFEWLVASNHGHVVVDFDGTAIRILEAATAAVADAKDLADASERVARHRHADRLARGVFPGPCATTTGDYTRTFRWDEAGRALGEKGPDVEIQLQRDASGRLVGRRVIGANQTLESRITVDARGLEIAEQTISPDETGRVPVGLGLTKRDARGRIVRHMWASPDGIVTETFRWEGQRLVASSHDAPDAHEHCVDMPPTEHQEDAAGRVIRQVFRDMPGLCETDRIVTWKRDDAGNVLVERFEPLGVDAGPAVETRYDYSCWSK
jgi:YD repeat-containing protein